MDVRPAEKRDARFFIIFGEHSIIIMKHFFSFFIILFAFVLKAQIPPGYYNSAAGLSGSPLKSELHNIIKNHNTVSYSSLWNHFQTTDKKPNGKVWDMYSDLPSGTPPYEFTFVSDQCGSYGTEADCFNREHSWPQSWFSSATVPSSDLFHIYPTDGYVNNRRSNYPYGNVSVATWTSLNGSKLGLSSDAGYSSTVFEPIDEYKGDLARSFFYMSTRYLNEDASWSTSGATNKSVILPWEVNVLLQWHHQDTVSVKEIARNNTVYGIQNNRNPYIDKPQWVDSIWTVTPIGIEEFVFADQFRIYPDPSCDFFNLSYNGKTSINAELYISNVLGEIIYSVKEAVMGNSDLYINCEDWKAGIYFITVKENEKLFTLRFVKI